ncbi:MAG: radical SAM protein [Planctomycetota bacterium]
MRSRRPISINNSLVHGICNCNCSTCGVNKPAYHGPRAMQEREVTDALIRRVLEAAREGVHVRYIANSGDGEPTLHPEFTARMNAFGGMRRSWSHPTLPAPDVSVVTNGLRLVEPEVLDAICDNDILLFISFPTCVPEHYGEIMFSDAAKGKTMLTKALAGIQAAMKRAAAGELKRLAFHVSPPVREHIRGDFAKTLECLSSGAAKFGLKELEFVLFPATSNRTGLIPSLGKGIDFFKDLTRRYHNRTVNGVRIRMAPSFKRFYPRFGDLVDLMKSHDAPCIWNGNLFISPFGDSACCNDQTIRWPEGNILSHSVRELMEKKETRVPGPACRGCDQRPEKLRGSLLVWVYRIWAGIKTRRTLRKAETLRELPACTGCAEGCGSSMERSVA